MKLVAISSSNAPAAIGPYSQAIKCGDFIFCSGQIPLDPKSGEVVGQTAKEQAEQVMQNIDRFLTDAGSNLTSVVKTTIFLIDMNDFADVNEVYGRYFSEHKPARSTVAVAALPKGVKIEIEVVAVC